MNKKIVSIILIGILSLGVVGCGDPKEETKESNTEETKVEETKEEDKKEVDIDKLDTKEDIDNAYLSITSKIRAKEPIRELDMFNIKLDNVIEYANNASKKIDSLNLKGTEAIDATDKLVALDDLDNNTTQDILEESINYVISQYKSDKILNDNEVKANMYICRYIYVRITRNHPNMKNEKEVINDLYQMCKDTIRNDNSRMDENKKQVEKGLKKINY